VFVAFINPAGNMHFSLQSAPTKAAAQKAAFWLWTLNRSCAGALNNNNTQANLFSIKEEKIQS